MAINFSDSNVKFIGKSHFFEVIHNAVKGIDKELEDLKKYIPILDLIPSGKTIREIGDLFYKTKGSSCGFGEFERAYHNMVEELSYKVHGLASEKARDEFINIRLKGYYEFENYLANNLSEEFINKLSLPLAHVSTGGPDIRIFLDNLTNEEAKWFRKLVRKFPNPKRENGMPYFNVWATKNSSNDIFIIF